MTSLPWGKRPSNQRRISYSQFLNDFNGRQSRSVERPSRIPLRSSSQTGRDKIPQPQSKQRSKSQVLVPSDTPLSRGKVTPSGGIGPKITPGTSSNFSNKKSIHHKDFRKLQDKEFIKESSQLVQSYFQENCPEILINDVDIKPMTIKMFIAMINHLFETLGILDKGIKPVRFAVSTYEKELPYWMKKLEYPGMISKAWLQTVNVPQYWPHVVGLLSWLVKLCTVNLKFNVEEQLDFPPDNVKQYWAVFFFKKSMEAFKLHSDEGKEEEYKELCGEVVKKFRELVKVGDGVVDEIQTEINELKKKLEDPVLLADKDAFNEAEQHLRVLQSQHQKILDDIAKKEIDIEQLVDKNKKKKKQCSSISAQIEATKKEIEKLKTVVSKQAMSVEDITDIQKKTDYVGKEIKYLEKECDDYSQLISRYEMETAGMRDKILQSSHAFNRIVIQLQQKIPDLTKFHTYVHPEKEGVVEEMEDMLKGLENLKTEYIEKQQKLEEDLIQFQKSIALKKQRLKELESTVESQEKKNEAKKKEYEKLKKTLEEKDKYYKEETEKWNEKIRTAQEKMKEIDDLKDNKEKLELRYESLCQSLKDKELFWHEFWIKVAERWKGIPTTLERLLNEVEKQNQQLERNNNQESEKE